MSDQVDQSNTSAASAVDKPSEQPLSLSVPPVLDGFASNFEN